MSYFIVILIVTYIFNNNLTIVIYTFSGVLIGHLVLQFFVTSKSVKITAEKQEHKSSDIAFLSFNYLLALLSLSVISFGDKILITEKLGVEVVGNYFYLSTLCLFPFSLLQSYIGFKELVAYKEQLCLKKIYKSLKKATIFGVLVAFALFVTYFFLTRLNILHISYQTDLYIILVLLGIGVIKLNYGILSSVLGARASVNDVVISNSVFIISLVVLVTLAFYTSDLIQLLLYVLLAWVVRLLIWFYVSRKLTIRDEI